MSTLTNNYGFVKAAGTEQYDVAVVNANLDAIDAALDGLDDRLDAFDGEIEALSGVNALSVVGGWTLSQAELRRRGPLTSFWFLVVRSGAAISSPASGDIGNTLIGTVPAGWRPIANYVSMVGAIFDQSSVSSLETSGEVKVTNSVPSVSIATNDRVSGYAMYFSG